MYDMMHSYSKQLLGEIEPAHDHLIRIQVPCAPYRLTEERGDGFNDARRELLGFVVGYRDNVEDP